MRCGALGHVRIKAQQFGLFGKPDQEMCDSLTAFAGAVTRRPPPLIVDARRSVYS